MKQIIVALVMAMALVLTPSSAFAGDDVYEPERPITYPTTEKIPVPECQGSIQLRADNWSENVVYNDPVPPRGHWWTTRLTATLIYWYCPNGDRVNKVKAVAMDFCYSHFDSGQGGLLFDGAKFNPYLYDDNETTNPPETIVPDDGTMQNCRDYDIPTSAQKWFEMTHSPRWKVTAWIRMNNYPDFEKVFDYNGHEYKLIVPTNDVALGPWE